METEINLLNKFLSRFGSLADIRRGEGQRHKQEFVLMIVLLATMSGYLGYRAIGDFIEKHKSSLVNIFKPPKGRVPSFSTVRRILIAINAEAFKLIYQEWLEDVRQAKVSSTEVINGRQNWHSVDGKTVRGANQMREEDHVHLVSIFSFFDKVAVDSAKVEDKTNEIPCVQKMIQESDLQGVIFTFDALHCQKKRLRSL